MLIPINVLKNGQSILRWFNSASISMVDSGYCYSVDLSLNSLELWDDFDPDLNRDELNLKILIGEQSYEFLCEEREVPIEKEGSTFSVWGRTKQALLDKPYAKMIRDTEETDHPWQTGDIQVSSLISYLLSNFTDNTVTVSWNVENFLIYKDSLSIVDKSPIEVISDMANVLGAKLNAHPDGSLTIDYYSVQEETPVESYNDFDHIVSLEETTKYSDGYNAVTVYGRGATNNSTQLQAEVLDEEETWIKDVPRIVRVYYYHPEGLTPVAYMENGEAEFLRSGVESITEDVLLTWGSGSYSKFDKNGEREVTGDEEIPIKTISVTYEVNYFDFNVTTFIDEENIVAFYFEDKSALTTLTIYLEESSKICEALEIDLETNEDDSSLFRLKIYGDISYITEGFDVMESIIPIPTNSSTEDVEEFVVFSEGKANLSKPYFSDLFVSYPGINRGIPSVGINTKELSLDLAEDHKPFGVYVSYKTKFYYEDRSILSVFLSNPTKYTSYSIYFVTECGGLISSSISVPNTEEEEKTKQCEAISAEFVSAAINNLKIRVYGNENRVSRVYDQYGQIFTLRHKNWELVTEDIVFSEGSGSLSKPYADSMRSLETIHVDLYTKDATIDIEDDNKVVNATYRTSYCEESCGPPPSLIVVEGQEYTIFVETECGETLTVSTTIGSESECGDADLEIDSSYENGIKNIYQNDVLIRRLFYFRYYGDYTKIKRVICSSGNSAFVSPVGGYDSLDDFVAFSGGSGSLSKPYYTDLSVRFTTYSPVSPNPSASCERYSKTVVLGEGPDYEGDAKNLFANVSYKAFWHQGYTEVPLSYTGEFTVYVETDCGDLLSVSTTIEDVLEAEYKDITINIKDYATDVAVANASVWVDDFYRGLTDSEGNITLTNIQTGDHTLKIRASGYLDSEEDELSNDTFTVS